MKKIGIYLAIFIVLAGNMIGCAKVSEMQIEDSKETDIETEIHFSKEETFAKEVKQQILDYDWEGLSDEILYPITIGERVYQTKEEFLKEKFTYDDQFRKWLEKENCEDLVWSEQGIMLGETGQVWIGETPLKELKVFAINGLLNSEAVETRKKGLNMDKVIEIASLSKDFLKLNEELRSYWIHTPREDLEEGSLNDTTTYSIWYQEEEYLLDVTYKKKYKELDSIRIYRVSDKETLILYFAEKSYEKVFQAGKEEVEAYLERHRQISDYMTADLPENLTIGQFYADLGYDGGSCLISSKKEIYEYIEDLIEPIEDWNFYKWYLIGGMCCYTGAEIEWKKDKIQTVGVFWNHSELIGEGERLEGCQTPAYLELIEHDLYTATTLYEAEQKCGSIPDEKQTFRIWYIFFAKPESSEVYSIWLNADLYDREEIVQFAESVRFTENAFTK